MHNKNWINNTWVKQYPKHKDPISIVTILFYSILKQQLIWIKCITCCLLKSLVSFSTEKPHPPVPQKTEKRNQKVKTNLIKVSFFLLNTSLYSLYFRVAYFKFCVYHFYSQMGAIYNLLEKHRLEAFYNKFLQLGVKDERDFIDGVTDEDLKNLGMSTHACVKVNTISKGICTLCFAWFP